MKTNPNLALIGKDISHSRSQEVYEKIIGEKLDYLLLDFQSRNDIPTLVEIFNEYSLDGLSITAPYKNHFIQEVQVIEKFSDLGAINCIRRRKEASSEKYFEAVNTDYLAIDFLLDELFKDREICVALLGDGAMSHITELLLKYKNIQYKVFSRKKNENFSKMDLNHYFASFNSLPLIINSCSREFEFAGSFPTGSIFWDYNYGHIFHSENISKKNCKYIDGLSLLELQAKFALDFWGIQQK